MFNFLPFFSRFTYATYSKFVVLLFALCFVPQVHANAKLQALVDAMQSYEADFIQTQPDETMFQTNEAKGRFKLLRPGHLIWSYQTPTEQEITLDGTNIWVYDVDLEQVTVRQISDVKNDIPLSWLLYEETISKRFTIIDEGERDGMIWFNLVPKETTYFQSIEIGFKQGLMESVWMYQADDNVTKVFFNNIQLNSKIASSQFKFKVPAGVDVIGSPQ